MPHIGLFPFFAACTAVPLRSALHQQLIVATTLLAKAVANHQDREASCTTLLSVSGITVSLQADHENESVGRHEVPNRCQRPRYTVPYRSDHHGHGHVTMAMVGRRNRKHRTRCCFPEMDMIAVTDSVSPAM